MGCDFPPWPWKSRWEEAVVGREGGRTLICRVTAHYPTVETKKLFINAASIKPINPWKKVNLQKAELHSQC